MPVELDAILERLGDSVSPTSNGYRARCPAHDDKKPSLSISTGANGRVLLYCHSRRCSYEKILRALGIEPKALPHQKTRRTAPLGEIVAIYQYLDETGTLLFEVVRYTPKAFRQRQPKPGGGYIHNLKGVRRVLYRLPELLDADSSDWVFVCEGEKDVDNLRTLGAIATTCPQGAGKWGKLSDDTVLNGRRVAILVDKDDAGRSHGLDVARRLHGRAADLRIIELSGDGKDATNWIEAGGTFNELLRLTEQAEVFKPNAPSTESANSDTDPDSRELRKTIVVDADEFRAISLAVDALAGDEDLFQRGGILVRVVFRASSIGQIRRQDGSWEIQPLPIASLRERIAKYARLIRRGKDGAEVHAHPPGWLVSGVDARGTWSGIRSLTAVSDVPILRRDGSIAQTPGYDVETGVLYKPGRLEFSEIPSTIDRDIALRARDVLLDVVADFPFERKIHRSAFLAALLTPLARSAFDGPSPLFLIDANAPGAGKGKLAQVIGRIALGREMAVSTYCHDGDELRKRLTTIAIAGDRMVLFDNLRGAFGNAVLDQALTSTAWADRILGRSERIEMPMTTVFLATGNNVRVCGDTPRRILHIRLDCLHERPELRTGFRQADLLGWVEAHRGELLAAALTILSGYLRAGVPMLDLAPYGSFEDWSRVVRAAVLWVDMPDPCFTRDTIVESPDSGLEGLRQLIPAWKSFDPQNKGLVGADLIRTLYPAAPVDPPMKCESLAMRAALDLFMRLTPGHTPDARRLGQQLNKYRRRVVNGVYIDQAKDTRSRAGAIWRLQSAAASN